jgi:hypothetical protein
LKAFAAYHEAHGSLPSGNEIASILDPDKAYRDARPWIDEWRKEFEKRGDVDPGAIEREDAMQLVRRGALQVVAAMLLDQSTQRATGDHELFKGIRLHEQAAEKTQAFYSNPKRRKISVTETLELMKKLKR